MTVAKFVGMSKVVAIEDCPSCGGNESLLFLSDYGGHFGICDLCNYLQEIEYRVKETPKIKTKSIIKRRRK